MKKKTEKEKILEFMKSEIGVKHFVLAYTKPDAPQDFQFQGELPKGALPDFQVIVKALTDPLSKAGT